MTLEQIIRLAAETGAKAAIAVLEQSGDAAIKETVEEIARKAAQAGAEALEAEKAAIRKKERGKTMDRRLYNTRLLLKHYRDLKAHFENAVYEFDQEQAAKPGEIWEIMNRSTGSEEVYIESIKRSAMRTMIIIQHIERITDIYAAYCERSELQSVKRQYRILKMRYLDPKPLPMNEIADIEHVHKRTAERDLDAAIESVTALLFGVDAIMQTHGRNP